MVYVISAAVIVGTGMQVYGQVQAGKAADDAAKEQARQAKIAADGEELKRREELNKKCSLYTSRFYFIKQ